MTAAVNAADDDETPTSSRDTGDDAHENAASNPAEADEVTVQDARRAIEEEAKSDHDDDDDEDEHEIGSGSDETEDGEDEEPQIKYDKITTRLASVYRNGDSSSALTVAGNKLVTGTDNGNVHVLALPTFQSLRTYKAHSASVLSCSISPPYPSLIDTAVASNGQKDSSASTTVSDQPALARKAATTSSPASPKSPRAAATQPKLTNSPDNAIHVATSSLDGTVCVFSLLDSKDVLIRNFARPVNAVALSPEYKSDRIYLSGGRAGQLVLTKGGKPGMRTDATINSATAVASGWLGSIGLTSDIGTDTILHEGEGVISTIKWSRSRKWVVWVNEEGIKIMRSHLRLGSEEAEYAWRRIAHAAKPNSRVWEEMAGVWKAKAQWVDDGHLESVTSVAKPVNGVVADKNESVKALKGTKTAVDKLVVGWGDTVWVVHVHEKASKSKQNIGGKMPIGSAEIVHKLHFQDCVVSGIAMFTPMSAAILAYRTRDDHDRPITPSMNRDKDTPRKGRAHRRTGLAPQLRLIDIRNGNELDVDELPMSRYETLSAQDYFMESLWVPSLGSTKAARGSKGALEGLWELSGGHYAQKLLSSSASVLSRSSSGLDDPVRRGSFLGRPGTKSANSSTEPLDSTTDAHQALTVAGLKLFIQSPYDCVLALKRQTSDHLDWLLSQQQYAKAWTLLDEHPSLSMNSTSLDDVLSISSGKIGQQPAGQSLADFLATGDTTSTSSQHDDTNDTASEKQRIGNLWISQLVAKKDWKHAGKVASQVLNDGRGWDHWIKVFANAHQLDHIASFVPTRLTHPVIPTRAYDLILLAYVDTAPAKLCELLDDWEDSLYDAANIAAAIREQLASSNVVEGSDDWRWLLEALARLSLSLADPREALKCYIRVQNAENAFRLIQEEKLADVLDDDLAGFVTLKVSKKDLLHGTLPTLDEASDRAINILAEEAHKATIYPASVIKQLENNGPAYKPFIFFYLRTLWRGVDMEKAPNVSRRVFNRAASEGRAMVEDHADLAVELFAEYDRSLLTEFLEASEVYDYNRAAALCEQKHYTQELVLVLNRTGQTKRALWLIIGELGDVSQAIAFVKQNPDLWDDLLDYGMDKPAFIRGLLTEVGTAVDPVKVIRHVPEGLEIDGLKSGILDLVQGWEVQLEVSRGVDRVLHGEVMTAMETLRRGQRQAIRFDILHGDSDELNISAVAPPLTVPSSNDSLMPSQHKHVASKPGHCAACGETFHEHETEPLIGFACGHVYHLSCLLRSTGKGGSKSLESVLKSVASDTDDEDDGSAGQLHNRSVGVKVAHAHLIRNAIEGGCPDCTSTSLGQ